MTTKGGNIIRSIYMYGVCLITVIVALFAATSLVGSIVDLAYPDPYSRYYEPLPYRYGPEGEQIELSAEELAVEEQRAEVEEQRMVDSQKRNSIVSLLRAVVMLIFTVPLFVLHWRGAERGPKGRKVDTPLDVA